MSPAHSSPEPLRRTNINLFEADVEFLSKHFGQGWQTELRNNTRFWVNILRASAKGKLTVGDLAND